MEAGTDTRTVPVVNPPSNPCSENASLDRDDYILALRAAKGSIGYHLPGTGVKGFILVRVKSNLDK